MQIICIKQLSNQRLASTAVTKHKTKQKHSNYNKRQEEMQLSWELLMDEVQRLEVSDGLNFEYKTIPMSEIILECDEDGRRTSYSHPSGSFEPTLAVCQLCLYLKFVYQRILETDVLLHSNWPFNFMFYWTDDVVWM